jgi:hypothetical protein
VIQSTIYLQSTTGIPGIIQAPANHKGGISVKTPRFFPVPI